MRCPVCIHPQNQGLQVVGVDRQDPIDLLDRIGRGSTLDHRLGQKQASLDRVLGCLGRLAKRPHGESSVARSQQRLAEQQGCLGL